MSLSFSIQKVNYKDRDLICGICRKLPKINSPKEWVVHPKGGEQHPFHLKCAKDALQNSSLCPSCRVPIDRSSLLSLKERVNVQAHELRPWVKGAIVILGISFPYGLPLLARETGIGELAFGFLFVVHNIETIALALKMYEAKADILHASVDVFGRSWSSVCKNAALVTVGYLAIAALSGISSEQMIRDAAVVGISQAFFLSTIEKSYEIAKEALHNLQR